MTPKSNRNICLAALAAAGLTLAGCSSTTSQSFNNVKNSRVEASQVDVNADFGKYDTLNAMDMGIISPSHAKTSDEDLQRIREIFRTAFTARLGDYKVVRNQTGPTTLTVQATLIDYRNASVDDTTALRRGLRDMAKPGSLIFLMELRDSTTDTILGRAADGTAAPAFATTVDTSTDWDSVEAAAEHWADIFQQFLDENLNQ